jgi:hypothetical protein
MSTDVGNLLPGEVGAAARLDPRFQLDQYTLADYKGILTTRYHQGIQWMAPTWMGPMHRRRIQAYTSLVAYRDNSSRLLLRIREQADVKTREERREYGDANLLVEQIRSAVIGDRQSISVVNADKHDPENPVTESKQAFEVQERLSQWAEDERFVTKLIETERNAVSMGDGVYSLGWSIKRNRVVLKTWDPSAYFPVITDDTDGCDYPERVHLAWEVADQEGPLKVRRITYDLHDVEPYTVPWSKEQLTKACFLTDATFVLDREARSPDDLSENQAIFTKDEDGAIQDRNLGIDFIPVIHIPNTVSEAAHFGRSAILSVLQILDDLQATDSDLQAAAALTGSPMVALSGDGVQGQLELGPNKALFLGANGSATMISGHDGLTALAKLRDDLLRRLSVNSRVPEAVLGRVDPNKIKAGVVLTLSFGPLGSLVEEMRLVRRDKYRLMMKFVQRFNAKQDASLGLPVTPILDGDVVFGAYLPSDQAGTATMVAQLLAAKAISLETGLKMLQEVGIPVQNIASEITAIEKRNYEAAVQLFDATNNPQAVQDKLGVKVEGPPPPPNAAFGNQPLPPDNQPQPNQPPGNQPPGGQQNQPPAPGK